MFFFTIIWKQNWPYDSTMTECFNGNSNTYEVLLIFTYSTNIYCGINITNLIIIIFSSGLIYRVRDSLMNDKHHPTSSQKTKVPVLVWL